MVHAARQVSLSALQEFRFELDRGEAVTVRLVSGSAEVFGLELALNVDYPFGDEARAAIFSWRGCELEISSIATEYVAVETPMQTWINLHLALERLRILARLPNDDPAMADSPEAEGVPGPRIMVVGERNSGKSTLVKTLINWAIRSGRARTEQTADGASDRTRRILLVNTDPDEGAFTIPATVSAAVVDSPLPSTTPVHLLGSTYATGVPPPPPPPAPSSDVYHPTPNPDTFPPVLEALSYYYGHTEWGRNDAFADLVLARCGAIALRKLDESNDEGLWRGGMIVDTPGEWTDKGKTQNIVKRVRDFGIDTLLVVGGERLQVEISKLMKTNQTVTVIRVAKSPDVSSAEQDYRRRMRDRQVHSYFYGGPPLSHGVLAPHSINVPFEHLTIYRIGEEYQAPSSALPIGAVRQTRDTALVEVEPTRPELLNAILALKHAPDDADEDDIVASAVLGFIHITSVDTTRKRFKILTLQAGRLPRKKAVVGSLDWQDV